MNWIIQRLTQYAFNYGVGMGVGAFRDWVAGTVAEPVANRLGRCVVQGAQAQAVEMVENTKEMVVYMAASVIQLVCTLSILIWFFDVPPVPVVCMIGLLAATYLKVSL